MWFRDVSTPLTLDIEAGPSGWQIHIPRSESPHQNTRQQILETLKRVVGWDNALARTLQASTEDLWVWIPAHAISGILWRKRPLASGIDYTDKAREAWTILRSRALKQETLTYGDLGHALGGLHPLHDVPQVLDVIQRWCKEHGRPDLTGLVVSQRSQLPGRDYWRQNGWADLPADQQQTLWQKSLVDLKGDPGPENAPY